MNLCFSQLCRRAKGDLMSVSFCLSSKIALSKFVPSLKSVVSQTRDLTLTFTPTALDSMTTLSMLDPVRDKA